jgi:hypothetical protein
VRERHAEILSRESKARLSRELDQRRQPVLRQHGDQPFMEGRIRPRRGEEAQRAGDARAAALQGMWLRSHG